MRIGIIGTGKHGSRYVQHVAHDVEGLTLGGISRRSADGQRQAGQWHTQWYSDWQELIADPAIDAVIGVTPPILNLEIARRCAEVKKPLLIEKPLARNEHEAAEIVTLMNKAGCLLTVGQTLRYNPVIAALHERLPAMGNIHSFAVNQRLEPSPLGWHDDPEIAGAGVVIHTAVHIFDALKFITGKKVVKVMAAGKCVYSNNLDDLVLVLAEFEDGVLGTVDVSKVGKARSGRYEFICENGQLYGDQVHGCTSVVTAEGISEQQNYPQVPTILPLLNDWQQFLAGQSVNPVSGDDGLYAVRVCEACISSAASGSWIEVSS